MFKRIRRTQFFLTAAGSPDTQWDLSIGEYAADPKIAEITEVVAVEIVDPKSAVLTATSQGYGKKTTFKEYRTQSRGGKGIINTKVTKKNGFVVNVISVADDDEIILVTENSMVVRTQVNQIRSVGRNTQGVRLIKLKPKDEVATAMRVVSSSSSEE